MPSVSCIGFAKAVEYATLDSEDMSGRMKRFREFFKQALIRTSRGVDRFTKQIPVDNDLFEEEE